MASKRTCSKGHTYYKSSDCPTCPTCETERQAETGFLSNLAAPARRALENHNITSLKILSQYSKEELLQLHGFGKSSLPKLQESLAKEGLSFKTATT